MNNSYWESLGATITPAYKRFYGKYLYKIRFRVPSSQYVIHAYKKGFTGRALADEVRACYAWRARIEQLTPLMLPEFNEKQLIALGDFITSQSPVKARVEEPLLDFYFLTEQQAMAFVSASPDIIKSTLVSVSAPQNQQSQNIVSNGYLIMRKPTDYRYLVTLPEGKYDFNDTRRLLAYLIGVEAKLSQTMRSKLSGDYFTQLQHNLTYGLRVNTRWNEDSGYFNGIRFYIKNEADISWLHLMWPKRIGKIQEVRHLGVNTDKE